MPWKHRRYHGFALLFLAMICSACNQSHLPVSPAIESTNAALLKEANSAAKWFHAKKTRPIWARRLEEPQSVQTLEGKEEVPAGHFLCKGEAGDIWPQTEQTLNKRYVATDEVSPDGWRKYAPHPDAEGVMATPIDHSFTVQTRWGEMTGKPGDFLLKNFQDRDNPDPTDVWIVDQKLFAQTYSPASAEE